MHLSDYSLRQIDDVYLQYLEVEALRNLSLRLLADLQEARERLNQGPTNSSRPSSSRIPRELGGASVPEQPFVPLTRLWERGCREELKFNNLPFYFIPLP
jgi:hypothetical protein